MNIRKNNKVQFQTARNVTTLGTVMALDGDKMTVETAKGKQHTVDRQAAVKLTAVEYRARIAEATQPKVTVAAKKVTQINNVNKKASARIIFMKNKKAKRKEVIQQFISDAGLSSAGASTYYQNFKSGIWA